MRSVTTSHASIMLEVSPTFILLLLMEDKTTVRLGMLEVLVLGRM